MGYLVDTYALIGWFRDRNLCYEPYFRKIQEEGAFISDMVLMEFYFSVYHHEGKEKADAAKLILRPHFIVLRPSQEKLIEAAMFRSSMVKKNIKMSYVDSALCILAKEKSLKILTGDEHFKGLPYAEFVK